MEIILTHDVDSILQPISHVLKRRKRFKIKDIVLHALKLRNLYNNIEDILALEDSYGFRSTFFIPVALFPLDAIEDVLKEMVKNGWEVALHFVVEKCQLKSLIILEKEMLENLIGNIYGVRTHMLTVSDHILSLYREAGFLYDSSYRVEEVGKYDVYRLNNGLIEVPIAIMDADLFGRLKMNEEKAWRYILDKMDKAEKSDIRFFTILFHQESFKMKGGRLYKRLVRYIGEKEYEVLRCIDAVKRWNGSV